MRLQLGPALGAKGMQMHATVGAGSGSAGRKAKVGAFAQTTPESVFNGVAGLIEKLHTLIRHFLANAPTGQPQPSDAAQQGVAVLFTLVVANVPLALVRGSVPLDHAQIVEDRIACYVDGSPACAEAMLTLAATPLTMFGKSESSAVGVDVAISDDANVWHKKLQTLYQHPSLVPGKAAHKQTLLSQYLRNEVPAFCRAVDTASHTAQSKHGESFYIGLVVEARHTMVSLRERQACFPPSKGGAPRRARCLSNK